MIYFMQATDGAGAIKIGYTENVERRRKQLESHYKRPLAVLAVLPGDLAREREIHERFSHLRLDLLEQFRPASELMEFIHRPLLVGANPELIEAMPGPRKPDRDPNRNDVTVKVHRSIAMMAKTIAKHEGLSVAEVVSEAARASINKRYAQMIRDLEA